MLVSLHIRNYILIDSLDINFPEGLIIITGQTGAGKSIMLGALSLLSGAKADVSMISQDADSCVIEAEFKLHSQELTELLKSEDIDSDGDDIVIRRVLNRSGRSRCFVNDCPVAISVLQDISSLLIDIHSQHKSLLLSDKQFQLAVLDHFAGNETLLQECSSAYRRQTALKSETAKLSAQLSRAQADSDYNTAQLQQLQDAALKEDELEELEAVIWPGKGTAFGTAMMAYLDAAGNACPVPDLFLDTMMISGIGSSQNNRMVYNKVTGANPICFLGDGGALSNFVPVPPFKSSIMELLAVHPVTDLQFYANLNGHGQLQSVDVTLCIAGLELHKTYSYQNLRLG
ncbi:MAG: AAA family ATPase, partial [Bacteroidales bacterium]|nr:AAA family ATPase [Bacteroidales bacterium]